MATHSSILAWRIPMDRGAWGATVHGVAKSQTWLKQPSTHSNLRETPEGEIRVCDLEHLSGSRQMYCFLGGGVPKTDCTPTICRLLAQAKGGSR